MLNRIYIIVGLIAIVALAGAFIVPRFIHWGDYRDRMEMLAESVFGTEVTIRGDIDFALLPAPRLAFSDVVIGPADKPVATIGSVEAQFALMDFLRDQYNLSALILKAPAIDVALDDNGLLVSGIDLSGAGEGVALDQARIEGGRLSLTDQRSGERYALSAINGDLKLGSFSGPFQFQGNAVHDNSAYSVRLNSGLVDADGTARVSAFVADGGAGTSLTLDGALATGLAPKFDGTMVFKQSPPPAENAENIRGNLVLESKVTASSDRIVLNGYTLMLDENRSGMRLTGAASIQLGARNAFEAVVSGGVFTLPPRDADEDGSQMPYELVRLLGELPAPPMPPIPGQIGIDLAEIGLRGAALRNVRIDARTNGSVWTISRAQAELPGNTKVSLSGALRNDTGVVGFNGDLALSTQRLDALSQLWRKPAENTPLFNVPAELTGQVMLAGDALGFSHGRLVLDGKTHALEIRLGFGTEPRLDLVGRLDDLGTGDSAVLGALFPDPATDRTFAISFPEGSFSLNSQAIRVLGLDAADLALEGSWSPSGINVSKLVSSDLGGVTLNAKGDLAGTLAAPLVSGSGRVEVATAAAPGLSAFYDYFAVPAAWRPALGRSAPLALDFTLAAGDEAGSRRLTLNGDAGTGKLDVSLETAADTAAPARIIASLDATDGEALTQQLLGADIPLFSSDGAAFASLYAERKEGNGFETRVSLSQGDETLAYAGTVSALPSGELTGAGTLDASLADSSGLATLAGASGVSLGSIEASAGVSFTGLQRLAVSGIAGSTSGSAFSGDLSLTQVAQRPSIEGTMHFDRLSGQGLAAALFSATAMVPGSGIWPDGPLAVATTTRSSRGSMAVSVGTLAADATELTNAGFTLGWDPQNLSLTNLKGTIGGGSLTATLSQCCAGPLTDRTVSGRVSLDNVDLKALAPGATSGIAGRLTASGSFEGTGASLASVMSSLAGEGNFAVSGFSADRLNPGVYPALAGLTDVLNIDAEALNILVDQSLGQGAFTAPSAAAAFTIAGGRLRLANAIIEGANARLAGGVDLALDTFGLSGSFVMTPANFTDPSGLVENDAARIIARVGGTLLEPEIGIDISELVAAIQVRANELEVDRLEALRIQDEARQREAAEARNRLIEEQRRKAAEEAAARAAAEEAARQALEAQQPATQTQPPPFSMAPETIVPGQPLDLNFNPNTLGGNPANQPVQ